MKFVDAGSFTPKRINLFIYLLIYFCSLVIFAFPRQVTWVLKASGDFTITQQANQFNFRYFFSCNSSFLVVSCQALFVYIQMPMVHMMVHILSALTTILDYKSLQRHKQSAGLTGCLLPALGASNFFFFFFFYQLCETSLSNQMCAQCYSNPHNSPP